MYFFICTVNTRTYCFVYSSKWKIAEYLKRTEQKYKMLCTRDAVEIYYSTDLQNLERKYIRTH